MSSANSLKITLLSLVMFAGIAAAESPPQPRLGYLPDGRAYRIDEDGNKLIDQIAELETIIDNLQRQVRVLEDEISSKDYKIKELGGTPQSSANRLPPAAQIKEADIPLPKTIANNASTSSGMPPAATSAPSSCDQFLAPLAAKITRLEDQLATQTPAATTVCYDEATVSVLREQITSLQDELMKGPAKEVLVEKMNAQKDSQLALSKQREKIAQNQQALKIREIALQEKEAELRQKNMQVVAVDEQLSEKQQALQLQQNDLRAQQQTLQMQRQELTESNQALAGKNQELASKEQQLAQQNQELQSARAKLVQQPQPSEPAVTMRQTAAQEAVQEVIVRAEPLHVPVSDTNGVANVKSRFESSLNEISALIIKRKDLLDHARRTGKGNLVRVTPLISSAGYSLDILRGRVSRLNETSEIAVIRAGLREIKQGLLADVEALRRLTGR